MVLYQMDFCGKNIVLQLTDTEDFLAKEIFQNIISVLQEKRNAEQNANMKEAVFIFHELKIYPLNYQVYLKGRNLKISTHEFETLLLLASSAGQVFSKEQIYRAVWKEEPINFENAVMCCISQLRKKIEPDPRKTKYIQTVRGAGYKFVAPEE